MPQKSPEKPLTPEIKAAENMKITAARQRDLEAAISSITKAYGDGSIMRLGDAHAQIKIDVIPTGALAVDLALGVGGLPRGRVIEIYGPESSGKTTLMLHVIANAQKAGGLAAFIEAEMGMATMGMQARLMSQALRKLTAILSKSKTTCIFTNQLREKVGVMFGSPETTPGGKALKFYASVRIDIRRKDTLKDAAGNATGNHVKVKIVKNKVAPPFAEAEFDIVYNHGIDKEGCILDVGIEAGAVDKKGAWLQFAGELIGQGKEAARQALVDKPDLAKKIVSGIMAKRNAPVQAAA